MAETNFRGPVNSMGSLEIQGGATATVEPLDGPSLFYQGDAVPDPRTIFAKDGQLPGRQLAFQSGMSLWAVDGIPQARSTTTLAAQQAVATALTAFSLATVGVAGVASAASVAVGVPIIPVGTSVVTYAIALDFGFTTGTATANSSTVAVIDNTRFEVGQWIVIGNVGNAAATRSLLTQVKSIATANTTGITISPVAATTLANVPIGQANLWGSSLLPLATQYGPSAPAATAAAYGGPMEAGFARVMNPNEMLARNLSIALETSATFSAVVNGWDVWGNAMTEVISVTSQTTAGGKKAFKYIGSVTSGAGSTTTGVAIGLGDTFGVPFRADSFGQVLITWNNVAATNSNGFSNAVLSAATNTSGDVRGSVQISTAVVTGGLATAVSLIASNGTGRLTIFQNIGVWNQVNATPVNTAPLFGVAQATA